MKALRYLMSGALFPFLIPVVASAEQNGNSANYECCQKQNREWSPLQRGRCGKKRGDFYGMRRPVRSIQEARQRLSDYYSEKNLTVSELAEKPWRFEAEVKDSDGKTIDRVMIDKRSGRVRSLY